MQEAKAQYSPVREIYLDWLEPIFITRTQHKRMPNQQRQLLRMVSWSVSWQGFLGLLVELRGKKGVEPTQMTLAPQNKPFYIIFF